MKLTGAGLSHDLNLASSSAALIGTVHGTARFELGDGFDRKLEAKVQLLKLVIDSSGIHTVDVKVVVFLGETGKANLILGAPGIIDSPGYLRLKTLKASSVHRELIELLALDYSSNLGGGKL
jgi:hypothetical protein